MTKNNEPSHEEKCPVKGLGKWKPAGQQLLPHSNGKVVLLLTTVICEECGHIKINMSEVQLPVGSGLTIAIPQFNSGKK